MATDAAIKKTISSMTLLKEQHRQLDARWPMLQTILWLVVIGVALLFMPFSWLVTTLYDGLQLHLWWPVLILLLAFLFQKASDAGYQSSGLPQFLPGWALGLTILFLCTAILLMNATSADWSVGWLLILFTGLVLAIYRILPGLIGYSELWRLWVNSAVIETVGDQLLEQQFVEDLQSDRLHNEWGSLHKLTTLRGFYKATIIEVTLALLNGSTSTDSLIKCLLVGENLRQYLSLRWHEELLSPQRKQHEEEDLVRQLLTISLIAGYRQPSQQNYQDKLITNPLLAVIATNSELASSNYTDTALQQWLNSFQARQDSFGKLLNLIFTLGNRPEEFRSLTEIRECITQVHTLFSELPSADRQHNEQVELGQREICLATWLALAHRALPAQICFDVWLDLSKQNTTDPLLIAVNINDPEPVVIEAALFLANFYDRWSNQTPVFWNSGLQARAAYVRLQIDQIRQQITTQSSPLG
jgi:uncharacterized membrane protein